MSERPDPRAPARPTRLAPVDAPWGRGGELRTIEVAYAITSSYSPWAATSMLSIAERTDVALRFHVLHAGQLDHANAERLAATVKDSGASIVVHDVDPARLRGLPAIDRFGMVVWLRFLLPELLPDLDRVLYLDSDTFATDSIERLWALPLEDAPIGAVSNIVHPCHHPHVRSLGLQPGQFFNSGVLMLGLDEMRRRGSSEHLLRFARDHADALLWPDQDALNVVFAGQWRPLDLRWNAQNSILYWRRLAEDAAGVDAVRRAIQDPGIVHFEGPTFVKPWHALCGHPRRAAYRETLARTPWAGHSLEDDRPVVRILSRLPFSLRTRIYPKLAGR